MNFRPDSIPALDGRCATLAGLARNNEGMPTFRDRAFEPAGRVFVYDARRAAIVVALPVEETTTAMRANRAAHRLYAGDDRIRVVRDGRTGKLAIQSV